MIRRYIESAFTHLASSHVNLLEQKKVFTEEKRSTPKVLLWETTMAAVLLFWNTKWLSWGHVKTTYIS